MLKNLRLSIKLGIAFIGLGLLPLVAVAWVIWDAMESIEADVLKAQANRAGDLTELIDRNLFERYGDVQAFGLNTALRDLSAWYELGADNNPIAAVANQYVDTYDVYSLALVVDTNGKVVAVNDRDAEGKPLNTSFIYAQNFSSEAWFKDAIASKWYQREGGTISGTVVTDFYADPLVQKVYGGDGFSLAFSAPFKDAEGRTVGVWRNVMKFSVVEEIIQAFFQNIKSHTNQNIQITLLDATGRVIAELDPSISASSPIVHDSAVIGKLNLVSVGFPASFVSDSAPHGAAILFNPRKGENQTVGFSLFDGALGFPGLPWRVLVHENSSEALALEEHIIHFFMIISLAATVLLCLAATMLSRAITRPIRDVAEKLGAVAKGNLTVSLPDYGGDEVGQMAASTNVTIAELAKTMSTIREMSSTLASASQELTATSQSMGAAAEETSAQAGAVASAAGQIGGGVQSIATSMEEMESTVKEISKNAHESSKIAQSAVQMTANADQTMKRLSESCSAIGAVLTSITSIAEQTNLLALNATIEAARAGEAGKGFAVVANEVKELAKETARATEDIRNRITGTQADSAAALAALGEVSAVIDSVNGIAGVIAAAVEEQSATTTEVSKRVEEVATGSASISDNIQGVATAAQETSSNASQTSSAAVDLARLAQELQTIVGRFQCPATGSFSAARPNRNSGSRQTGIIELTDPAPLSPKTWEEHVN